MQETELGKGWGVGLGGAVVILGKEKKDSFFRGGGKENRVGTEREE